MDNSGLASLFNSFAGSGNPALDAALGIQPLTDEEIAAYQARLAGLYPQGEPLPEEPIPQAQPQRQAVSLGGPSTPYDELIYKKATAAGQDPNLVKAQIWAESNFNPNAKSDKGALGLTQFIPSTWAKYGKGSPYDPVAAIDAQIAYNADLSKRFGGDERKMLAAYNWGEHRDTYSLPDWERRAPRETQDYVKKILAKREEYAGSQQGAQQTPQAQRALFSNNPEFQPHIVGAGISKHPISQTRPELQDILKVAAQNSPYDVQFKSGYRKNDDKQHGKHNAIDVQLVDRKTGKALSDYQDPTHFKAYEDFAHTVRSVQQQLYPELDQNLRWGGYFSPKPDKQGRPIYGALDLMHFDLGGSKKLGMLGGSWEGGLTPEARKFWGISDSQGMGKSAPATQSYPAQPQIPEGMQPVLLSTGESIFAPQEYDLPAVAKALADAGETGVPMRDFSTPAGEVISVPFDMPDNVALAHLQRSAPELLSPQNKEQPQAPAGERGPDEGYGAAFKSGLQQYLGGAASGTAQSAYELEKQKWLPDILKEPVHQAGEWLQDTGEGLKEKAKVYHRPNDMTWTEENVLYPTAEVGGNVAGAAATFALPGVGTLAGTAGIFGTAMDEYKAIAEKEGKPYSYAEAVPYGLTSLAVNLLGLKAFGPLKNVLGKEAVFGARKAIMDVYEKEGLDAARKYVGTRLGNVAKQIGITGGAFTSGEVADNVISRAYAGKPLADPEAFAEYGATAKQMGPFAVLSGMAKGVGAHHVKAEAVEHLKEKQAQDQAVAEQQAAIAKEEELANVKKAEAAKKLAKRQTVEIPPELQGMPYRDAVNILRMQEEEAAMAAEAEAAPVEEAPTEPTEEPPAPEAAAPSTPEILNPGDVMGLPPKTSGLWKKFNHLKLDANNPEHFSQIYDALKNARGKTEEQVQKLVAHMTEVENAKQIASAGPTVRSGSAQPEIRQEGGDQTIGSQGMEPSGQGIKTPEVPKIEIKAPEVEAQNVPARPIEAAIPTGAGRKPSAAGPTGVLRAEEPSGGVAGVSGQLPEGKASEEGAGRGVDQLALKEAKIRRPTKSEKNIYPHLNRTVDVGGLSYSFNVEGGKSSVDNGVAIFDPSKSEFDNTFAVDSVRSGDPRHLNRQSLAKGDSAWDPRVPEQFREPLLKISEAKTPDSRTQAIRKFGEAVQKYTEQKKVTVKEAKLENPDRGIRVVNTPDYQQAKTARELFTQYKQRGTDPELLKLTDTLLKSPHLGDIEVQWVKPGEKVHSKIAEKFNTGTAAMAAWFNGEKPKLYFKADDPNLREDVIVHEGVHAVTEAALKRNPEGAKELKSLAKQIGYSLTEQAGFAKDPKRDRLRDFWRDVVNDDPGELLAYGLTSPSFREALKTYAADGKSFKAYRSEADMQAIRKGKERPGTFRETAPKELSLWDKFVDAVAKLFGLPSKRKEEFKRQLNEYLDRKAEYEKKVKDYNTLRPLQERLDQAFKELFKETSKKGVDFDEGSIKEAKDTAEERLKASGLAGAVKDKTVGEYFGQLKRDVMSEGRPSSFVTEAIDLRAGLRKGTEGLSSMVGDKLVAPLLYSAHDQRGNVIQGAYHDGYVALGSDGTVHVINDKQLAPKHIFQRVGKKNLELFDNANVAMRGKTIKAEDRQTYTLAKDWLNKADMLEEAAARTKDPKRAKSYNRSANNLRTLAEGKLDSINYESDTKYGRTHVTDQQVVDAEEFLKKHPDLAREATNLREALKKCVDLAKASGAISAEQAKIFNEYENYLPLYKSKSAEEFDKMMLDPLQHINEFISHAGRGLNTLSNVKKQKHHAHEIFVEENILRHIAFMTSMASENSARANTLMQLEMLGGATRSPHKTDTTVMFRRNGKEVYYEVHDPAVYAAMQAALPIMSPLLKRMKGLTNFARGVMVVNPLFWFRQIVREPLQASMVGKVGMVTPLDTLAAMARIASGKSEGYEKLKSKGVVGPVDVISDPSEFVKTALGQKGFISKGLSFVKHIHEVVDASTREAVYEKAKKDGLSKGMDEETASNYAVMRARELINFSKQGRNSMIRAARATTPFFGAALNSMDVMARAAFPKKLGKLSKAEVMEAQRNFYSNAMTLALYTTAYTMLMSDDDKYLNSSTKRGFWLVPKEGDPDHPFYKIAINFESGWFTKELPELLTLYNMGVIGKKEAITEGIKGFKELVMPPMMTIFAFQPLLEAATDHDYYTGNSINSERDKNEMTRYKDSKAGELTKLIVGKMEDKGINVLDMSPNQLEHVMHKYFGQLWGLTRAATDAYLYEGPPQVSKSLWDYPLASGVVAKASQDRNVNLFLDTYHKVAAVNRSYEETSRHSDVKKYEEIIQSEEYKKSIRAQRALEDEYKQMGDIKNQMETLKNLDRPADLKTQQMRQLEKDYRTVAREGVRKAKALGLEM